ncbi:MAG: protein nirF [Deltaproteobacteria bacterium]|nr:protein nirF [Deltaproteobacteria bacterium]
MKRLGVFLAIMLAFLPGTLWATGVAGRVFVVEREASRLAVYDYLRHELLPQRIEGLGDMRHALMAFSKDLRHGFVATRSGQLTRFDLNTLEKTGVVATSSNSIDIAISQDGRYIATAEYSPGGVTLLDTETLKVLKRIPATFMVDGKPVPSRVTGMVDAPGNRFAAVLMEGAEIWIIDASRPEFPIEYRLKTVDDLPYDAMITPDGSHYLVGHQNSPRISVVDLRDPKAGVKEISLLEPGKTYDRNTPVKMPHMASWAMSGGKVFVPLVGEARLAVLDSETWAFKGSVALRGNPVYAVTSPTGREVWVSFSGESDDAYVQVVDTVTQKVVRTIKVGGRIYHMDFAPRGAHILITANRDNRLFLVNANTYAIEDSQTLESPSGVFGAWRAFRIGL